MLLLRYGAGLPVGNSVRSFRQRLFNKGLLENIAEMIPATMDTIEIGSIVFVDSSLHLRFK